MRDRLIFKTFRKYNIEYTDSYLLCPICNKPFCNEFNGLGEQCIVCQGKQKTQFNGIFCGDTKGLKLPGCKCGQNNSMEKSILILYLKILMDYIDNLEYQLVCKERERKF